MSLKLEKDGIKIENLGLTLLCSTQNKKGMIYRNELSIKWEPTQPVLKKQKSNQKKKKRDTGANAASIVSKYHKKSKKKGSRI